MEASILSSPNTSYLNSVHVQKPTEHNLLAEQVLHKVLEYYCTHRPQNTTKAYALKQKEWQVFFFLLLIFLYCINLIHGYLKMVQA